MVEIRITWICPCPVNPEVSSYILQVGYRSRRSDIFYHDIKSSIAYYVWDFNTIWSCIFELVNADVQCAGLTYGTNRFKLDICYGYDTIQSRIVNLERTYPDKATGIVFKIRDCAIKINPCYIDYHDNGLIVGQVHINHTNICCVVYHHWHNGGVTGACGGSSNGNGSFHNFTACRKVPCKIRRHIVPGKVLYSCRYRDIISFVVFEVAHGVKSYRACFRGVSYIAFYFTASAVLHYYCFVIQCGRVNSLAEVCRDICCYRHVCSCWCMVNNFRRCCIVYRNRPVNGI